MVAAISIGNLGAHYSGTLDHRRARRLFVSSIRLNEKAGNDAGVGFFLSSLSGQLRHLGDLEGALAASQRSIAILEGMGAKRYLPTAYGHYASVLDVLGRFDDSEQWLAKAYAIADEIQLQGEFWKIAIHRALVALERGRVNDAQTYWQRALAWLRDHGPAAEIQQARADLAAACARLGIPDDGRW
jgi:tetratricopeptide (TPR) repeat protein